MAEKKGFWGGLFRKKAEPEPSVEGQKEEKTPEAVPVVIEGDPYLMDFKPESYFMKLWAVWKDVIPDPDVSLVRDGKGREFIPDKEAIQREQMQLRIGLEQEARRALSVIQELEKAQERQLEAQRLAREAAREAGQELPPEAEGIGGFALDAFCFARVSRNKMMAWLILFPPWGEGGGLRREMLDEALKQQDVKYGIDEALLDQLCQEPVYFKLVTVALGTPAREGSDGKIFDFFSRNPEKKVKVDEEGVADYRADTVTQVIEKGEAICKIIFPVEGTPGRNVKDEEVKPAAVKAAKVPRGTNTMVSEDGTKLVATLSGHLKFHQDAFIVKPVLEIPGDVDYSSGNIDFLGDVHIRGDVRETFSVRATGTITIDGLVEGAVVEAGEDIVVTCGVLGENSALIKSGGSIRAKYLENCVAYAGSSVVADCIMTSQIYSDGTIEVLTGRGTIIGGNLTAARSVKAKVIGTQSGRITEITLGMLPYVQHELANIETDLAQIKEESHSLDLDMAYLSTQSGLLGTTERTAKARLRKSVLTMKEQSLRSQREKLADMTQDLTLCRLEAGMVFPNTTVQVQNFIWRTNETRHSCRLSYDTKMREIRQV